MRQPRIRKGKYNQEQNPNLIPTHLSSVIQGPTCMTSISCLAQSGNLPHQEQKPICGSSSRSQEKLIIISSTPRNRSKYYLLRTPYGDRSRAKTCFAHRIRRDLIVICARADAIQKEFVLCPLRRSRRVSSCGTPTAPAPGERLLAAVLLSIKGQK